MAKGFKVKTVAPKQKGPEWDIDAIKERMKGRRLSSAFPVEDALISFSRTLYNFVLTWFRII